MRAPTDPTPDGCRESVAVEGMMVERPVVKTAGAEFAVKALARDAEMLAAEVLCTKYWPPKWPPPPPRARACVARHSVARATPAMSVRAVLDIMNLFQGG